MIINGYSVNVTEIHDALVYGFMDWTKSQLKTKREKKRSKRKENEMKRREEKRREK